MNVLLVDDYKSMTHIMRRLLEQLGFSNIDVAFDGPTALNLIRDKDYGLILSDWNMEPMSGIDLLKNIRGEEKNRRSPFVMVTSQSKIEFIKAARDAGASNYIVKPFNLATLKQKLGSVLGDW